MDYAAIYKLQKSLDDVVQKIIWEGTAETKNGEWTVSADAIPEEYRGNGLVKQLIADMLNEHPAVRGMRFSDDQLYLSFDLLQCAFYKEKLFSREHLDTTAIYTVCEDGEQQHFFTEQSGGYVAAFSTDRDLRQIEAGIKRQKLNMTSLELFPFIADNNRHPVGKQARLFRPVTETAAEKLLDFENSPAAFHVELNLDHNTVSIESNPCMGVCCLPGLTFPYEDGRLSVRSLLEAASPGFPEEDEGDLTYEMLYEKSMRAILAKNIEELQEQSDFLTEENGQAFRL